jgi:hypothetical protein
VILETTARAHPERVKRQELQLMTITPMEKGDHRGD